MNESDEKTICQHKPKTRGNGQGSVYKLPNGKYRVAVTLGYTEDGKRVYKTKSGFKTKKEAIAYIPVLLENSKTAKDIKFSTLYAEWKKIHFVRIGKSKQYSYNIAYKFCEQIYWRNISDLRLKDLQSLVDDREGGYYPKQDIKVLLNLMFKYAIQNDYIDKNYAQYIKLPPLTKSKREAFTKDEIIALWSDYKAGNNFTGYILIMIYTGMRYGELKILKKENIFLKEDYMIGGIKTDAGIDRQIVIAEKIKPIVTKFYMSGKKKLLEMAEDKFYEQFKETLKRIDIDRNLTPHCCRHTFATLMAESGVQPAIIKEVAGHENYQTTLQYTHISLGKKLEAVNRL